jgi:hypothetical protein
VISRQLAGASVDGIAGRKRARPVTWAPWSSAFCPPFWLPCCYRAPGPPGAFMESRGARVRTGADPNALRGEGRDELIVFEFARPNATEHPTCVSVLWTQPGDWKATLKMLAGVDASKVKKPKRPAVQTIGAPVGKMKVVVNPNGAGVAVGPGCES